MITFYNDKHSLHQGKFEMFRGELVPCHEVASRADRILSEIERRRLGSVKKPRIEDKQLEEIVDKVHAKRYLEFLRHAWEEWTGFDPKNRQRDVLPSVWPVRSLRSDQLPQNFAARMGLFSFDAGTPLTVGTWASSWGGAACAIAAANHILSGGHAAFVLTRPPGHHAGHDFFGGYCFINNAAVAAQALRDGGKEKVAILDVDYHHGNGTQAIFYDRADILFVSIHGDPATEYPFFLGYSDEKGEGAGFGCSINIPLPRGTGFPAWSNALLQALDAITDFNADALVVSLGLDTYAGDPISGFQLNTDDFFSVGEMIATLGLTTIFALEGGYALDAIGQNTANVLEGFHRASGRKNSNTSNNEQL
ncbi:MAG: histone deacetylase family protein [Cellvibrionaceae bacterium]|nr:histone deacetylase family protein [Cellvibrionaceae bacterium]